MRYVAKFPIGESVQIVDKNSLEMFMLTWKFHHPLQPEQISYAGKIAIVKNVSFYFGGDELYELNDIPGIWHEANLVNVNR